MRLAEVPPRFNLEFLEWLRSRTEAAWRGLPPRDRPEVFDTSRPIPPNTFVPLPTGNFWRNETRWSALTDAQIDAAEKRYGIAFPPGHRLFLRTLGRTLPLNDSVRFGEGNDGSDLRAYLLIDLADFLGLDHDEAYRASCAASRHEWSNVPLWGEFIG